MSQKVKITESKIERKVVEFCRKSRLLTFKFASPANRGVPDRIVVGKGHVLFMELKRPGNKPTALQNREIGRITEHGGVAVWVDSFESAKSFLTVYFNLSVHPKELI